MKVLLTGAAGYIGSNLFHQLREIDARIVLVDDFSAGNYSRTSDFEVNEIDISKSSNVPLLSELLSANEVDTVVHLAAKKSVPESRENPIKYFETNIGGTINLLNAMKDSGVTNLVFSSTAAVYGPAKEGLVSETSEINPTNPYGLSKYIAEELIENCCNFSNLNAISLRYFNVVGAPDKKLADLGNSNLFPMVFQRIVEGKLPIIFGNHYNTPDGTCIRDFIHVSDLASAHIASIEKLLSDKTNSHRVYNIGTGKGYSVGDVISSIQHLTGLFQGVEIAPPRAGDLAMVVANSSKARKELGWTPSYNLEDMISSSWQAFSS